MLVRIERGLTGGSRTQMRTADHLNKRKVLNGSTRVNLSADRRFCESQTRMIPGEPTAMLRFLVIIPIGLALATTAWADALVTAYQQGDSSTVARLGATAGASGLEPRLRSKDRAVIAAAIAAAPAADDAWALLGSLAHASQNPDRSIAGPAATTGAEIAAALDLGVIDEQEISGHTLGSWQKAWLVTASNPKRWVDIRIYALETAGRLHQLRVPSKRVDIGWIDYISDPDPEMRAAAITLADATHLKATIIERLEDDPEDLVALAAGQSLCGPLGATITLPALGEAAVARLQTLAVAKHLPIVARADLAPCLIATESKLALQTLAQHSPPMLKQELLRLQKEHE